MITNELIVEARARIIWGDEPASVRYFLTSSGVAAAEADAKIEELTLERNAEIRKLGIRDVMIGVALMAPGIFFFCMLFVRSHIPSLTARSGKGYGVVALVALYGLWRLMNGVIRLLRPKSEHGSIPDISE
jgi:hypothetical protein